MDRNQIKINTELILGLKKRKLNNSNLKICLNSYLKAKNQNYHAVAIDIDGTLCNYNQISPSTSIIESIHQLTLKKVIIVFITGRGRKSARDFVYDLRKILLEKYTNLVLDDFTKRWYCVTHSGLYLLYSVFDNFDSFLKAEKLLVKNTTLQSIFTNDLNRIYNYLIKSRKIKILLQNEDLITKEPGSIRIVLNEKVKVTDLKQITNYLKRIVSKHKNSNQKYYIISGFYKKNLVIEITISHKGHAIKSVANFIGISENNILRIGDRGAENENDYEMLASNYGFSVQSISKNIKECFPVINENNQVIYSVQATKYLINELNIYPTITLPNPTKSKYYNELSNFEKTSHIHSKTIYLKYSKIVSSSFQDKYSEDKWVQLTDIFDVKTGAIKFKDWEWNMIDSSHPFKKIFNYRDTKFPSKNKEPLFKYILKSDTSILLRGVGVYYFGIAFRNDLNNSYWIEEWYLSFILWLKEIYDSQDTEFNFRLFDDVDRKFFFAIIDNVRNFLLILLNSLLVSENKNDIAIISKMNMSEDSKNILEIAIKNTDLLYKLLFDGLYPFKYSDFFLHIENTLNILTKQKDLFLRMILKSPNSYLRVWREADFFLENFACVKDYFDNLINYTNSEKKFVVHGLLYGGIELPIIAYVISQYMDIETEISFIKLNFSYKEKHDLDSIKLDSINAELNPIDIHIIMDDNIMTGKTCQLTIDFLYKKGITPFSLIFVRYPSLNRIPQMFFEDHGAPDISLFNLNIFGLISATPYSRIFNKNIGENPYLDKTGVFNKGRVRLYRFIYKNGLFTNKELLT